MTILVIGDGCWDRYIYTTAKRLCPEAPVPVLTPVRSTETYGMAGNVKKNLEALGADVALFTNSEDITKTRYVDQATNQMFIRFDENDKCARIERDRLHGIDFSPYDAVVISDYNKGFLTTDDILWISQQHPLTFMDTKKVLNDWARDVTFIKLNQYEWKKSLLEGFVDGLIDKTILTLGSSGCSYQQKIYGVDNVEIKDVSGAGDTFLSGLVVEFVRSGDIEKALTFANECATVVVQHRGVTTI